MGEGRGLDSGSGPATAHLPSTVQFPRRTTHFSLLPFRFLLFTPQSVSPLPRVYAYITPRPPIVDIQLLSRYPSPVYAGVVQW
jgi:hypothetical protein